MVVGTRRVGYLQFETGSLGATTSPEFGTRIGINQVTKMTVLPRLELLVLTPGESFCGRPGGLPAGRRDAPDDSSKLCPAGCMRPGARAGHRNESPQSGERSWASGRQFCGDVLNSRGWIRSANMLSGPKLSTRLHVSLPTFITEADNRGRAIPSQENC
jgi:hypothetical protein